ncbi:MAG: methionine adenosyltransferase, partial [Promethearchaeota archaeon]
SSQPEFGGGQILQPAEFEIIGRAVDAVLINGKLQRIPVRPILRETIKDVFKRTLRNIDIDRDIIIDARTKSGSVDLTGLYNESVLGKDVIPLANDTSFGVGFAPLSHTEQMVLNVEKYLNSDEFKDKCPASGEDIKVMGVRFDHQVEITIAQAMVTKYVHDKSEYMNAIDMVRESALKVCDKYKDNHDIKVSVNTADIPEKDLYYLTLTGTSAESGDDGQVGRGNRANGLITPGRVQTLEAAAGKNSNNHVGKLYSLVSNRAAHKIIAELGGDVVDCQIRIVSQIGHPINAPWLGDIAIIPAQNVNFDNVSRRAKEILQAELDDFIGLRNDLLSGKVKVW